MQEHMHKESERQREQGKVAVREERWGLARESELLNLGESCTADCVLLIVCSF